MTGSPVTGPAVTGRSTTGPTAAGAPGLSIGRLTLQVPWMSEREAGRLAVLVAEALRAHRVEASAAGRLESLSVSVPEQPSAAGADLAGPIARAVLDALLRELA